MRGTGNITLKNLTDSTSIVIPITDPRVVISGNLLTVNPNPNNAPLTDAAGVLHTVQNDDQIRDRAVSFHAAGLQVVDSINSDGSWVGANATDGFAAAAGGTKVYKVYAEKEGVFNVTGSGSVAR